MAMDDGGSFCSDLQTSTRVTTAASYASVGRPMASMS